VTCPLHNKVTELDTGMAETPEKGCTKRYPVSIERDTIYIALEAEKEASVIGTELAEDAMG